MIKVKELIHFGLQRNFDAVQGHKTCFLLEMMRIYHDNGYCQNYLKISFIISQMGTQAVLLVYFITICF